MTRYLEGAKMVYASIGWRVVDGIVFSILGAILIARSPKGQRLGDRVADTVVVKATSRA
ncbi:MAG: hypothetical protein QN117_00580 [Armatimonadota bacterium]|nr:hypothetical protein [Armatimonadota bacterium]MDR7466453.1 hypothetical protein [Armatimonadota bacterium]MDR7493175.1 hypothetical protein [Armatimonadota bacterium]MDR7503534.1 hypothetical protein [Armatimonadota bacterium]MDR7545785.1 hypothetical protein [Armatimonadota bacterium]